MRAMKFSNEVYGDLQTGPSLVGTFLIVMAPFGVGKNFMAAKRRTEKNPPAGLSDDSDVILQRAGPTAGIEQGGRAVSERAVERVFASQRDRRRCRRLDFFFQGRAKDEPVGGEIIFLRHIGEQIIADIELRVNVQIDESRTNDFAGGIDHTIRRLRFIDAN